MNKREEMLAGIAASTNVLIGYSSIFEEDREFS